MKYRIARYLKQNSETSIIFDRLKRLRELKQNSKDSGYYAVYYALMLTATSLEVSLKGVFKSYLAHHNTHTDISSYIVSSIKRQCNFKYDNITRILENFNKELAAKFKNNANNHPDHKKILGHINSLSKKRDSFAHMGEISGDVSIGTILDEYKSSIVLIGILVSTLGLES